MKRSVWFFLFPAVLSGVSFMSLDLQVEQWQAEQQNQQIENLYKQLLESSITEWQKGRIYYNLGTIYLSQGLPKESLRWLEKIQPVDLSLPLLGDRLLYNRAVAYFQLAQMPNSIDERLFDTERGLLLAQNASFKDLFESGQKLLFFLRQQKREEWLKKEEVSSTSEKAYNLLVLEDNITEEKVQNFLEKKYDWSLAVQTNLDRALEALTQKKEKQGRFFLLLGLSELKNERNFATFSSQDLLKNLVQQADYSLQLLFLSVLASDLSLRPFLQQQQEAVVALAKTWVPHVLEEQKKVFSRGPCQELPWKFLIPLFDRGYSISLEVQKKWVQKEEPLSIFIEPEKKILKAWQEALLLFDTSSFSPDAAPSSESVQEGLRVLQEMYLEDREKRPADVQEFQGW